MQSRARGFTLIELMIVVAIIGILAALAIPAYNAYVTRSKLAQAYSALSSVSVAMQQYYQDNRSYADVTSASNPDPWPCANLPANSYFALSCSPAPTATSFTIQAVGTAPDLTTGGSALTFTIDQAGTKATTQVPAGWTAPSTQCWARDKTGAC